GLQDRFDFHGSLQCLLEWGLHSPALCWEHRLPLSCAVRKASCTRGERQAGQPSIPQAPVGPQTVTTSFTCISAAPLLGAVPYRRSAPPHQISQRHKSAVIG